MKILLLILLLSGCATVKTSEFEEFKDIMADNVKTGNENVVTYNKAILDIIEVIKILDKRIEVLEAEKGKSSW